MLLPFPLAKDNRMERLHEMAEPKGVPKSLPTPRKNEKSQLRTHPLPTNELKGIEPQEALRIECLVKKPCKRRKGRG